MSEERIIKAIHNAQVALKERPMEIALGVNRPALESILLTLVKRYREENETFVEGNKFDTIECPACEGSGIYEPNGGPCYRCTGKGHQLESDQKRNYGYDLHHPPVKSHDFEADAAEYAINKEAYDEDDIPF